MRTGRDWPVMSRNRKSKVVLHIDGNGVSQDLARRSSLTETKKGAALYNRGLHVSNHHGHIACASVFSRPVPGLARLDSSRNAQ